jgi:hypothetical protein
VAFRIRRILPLDHQVIGLQYALTALVFLLLGFSLMLILRWQLARPGRLTGLHGLHVAGGVAALVWIGSRRDAGLRHGLPLAMLYWLFVPTLATRPGPPRETNCSQLCGQLHYRRRGLYRSMTAAEYQAFLADQERQLGALP